MPFHYGYGLNNEIGVTNVDRKLVYIPILQFQIRAN